MRQSRILAIVGFTQRMCRLAFGHDKGSSAPAEPGHFLVKGACNVLGRLVSLPFLLELTRVQRLAERDADRPRPRQDAPRGQRVACPVQMDRHDGHGIVMEE
jgi:hypothetical protein